MIDKQISLSRLVELLKWDEPSSRPFLCNSLGISDRRLRKYIQELRKTPKDYVIVSSSHHEGYYKTRDPKKIESYIGEMEHRARETFADLKEAKRCQMEVLNLQEELL